MNILLIATTALGLLATFGAYAADHDRPKPPHHPTPHRHPAPRAHPAPRPDTHHHPSQPIRPTRPGHPHAPDHLVHPNEHHDANGFGPNGHDNPSDHHDANGIRPNDRDYPGGRVRRPDGRPWGPEDRPGRGWNDPNHFDRFDRVGGHGRYHVGDRLPWNYRLSYIDWRAHRLWEPPSGYYWAQVDNDFVLAALATGAIVSVINPPGSACPLGYWIGPWGKCRDTPYHGPLPDGGYKP